MWNGTKKMADAIGSGLTDEAVTYRMFHMAISDRNDVITEIFKARGVIVGSPTLNTGLLPTIAPIIEDLRGLKFKNKVGAAFGSYGWSGESVKIIEGYLDQAKITKAGPGILAKWQPTPEDLVKCREFGRTIGKAIKVQ